VRHPINSASLTRQCAAKFNIIDNNDESGASSYELSWNKDSEVWKLFKRKQKVSAKRRAKKLLHLEKIKNRVKLL